MRIAIVESGHWHAPMYAAPLLELGETICAASDQDPAVASRRAENWACKSYTSYQEMLEAEKPDFVFAFGIHAQMTGIADFLVEAGISFVMEKPMGVEWQALQEVAEKAERKGLFAGADLVMRCMPLIQRLLQLKAKGEFGALLTYHHQLLGGEPQRYLKWDVPWMLEPEKAGGGPLLNFGPHVVDLFLLFAGEPVGSVCCNHSHSLHRLPIEDYAALTLVAESGAIGTMDVSYTTPEGLYARHFSVSTDRLFVWEESPETGTIRFRDGRTEEVRGEGRFTTDYVRETLRRFHAGEPPVAAIGEMVEVLRVLNAAQESADPKSP